MQQFERSPTARHGRRGGLATANRVQARRAETADHKRISQLLKSRWMRLLENYCAVDHMDGMPCTRVCYHTCCSSCPMLAPPCSHTLALTKNPSLINAGGRAPGRRSCCWLPAGSNRVPGRWQVLVGIVILVDNRVATTGRYGGLLHDGKVSAAAVSFRL